MNSHSHVAKMQRLGERSLDWVDGRIWLVDQTQLPNAYEVLEIESVADLVQAIGRLAVRGAPAIGVAGGFGVVLAARQYGVGSEEFHAAVDAIRSARPTAVNLARMVDRVAERAPEGPGALLAEALAVRDEEIKASKAMGCRGAEFIELLLADSTNRRQRGGLEDPGDQGELATQRSVKGSRVVGTSASGASESLLAGSTGITALTICNTGGLATVERGTALGVIRTIHERGRLALAIALETRPLLQGSRLTAWELERMGAPYRLLVDSAGPALLARGMADVVLAGADRIAANGDVANKIGTFSLALAARYAAVPFVVVAPESSVDLDTPSGDDINIEDRGADEVIKVGGNPIAPATAGALNPAFDVTPAELITAIVTDRRVVRLDQNENLKSVPLEP